MMRERTASDEWLRRHRDTHARHPQFGTHAHPYLMELIGELASAATRIEKPSLLDYGCGKGRFLRAMDRSGWFGFVRGFDPAVESFQARPAQRYDLVLCLDVLDQVEDAYVEAVVADVARLTRAAAIFDVITVQVPALAHLDLRSPGDWEALIGRHMRVRSVSVRQASASELQEGACPERVIIVASARDGL